MLIRKQQTLIAAAALLIVLVVSGLWINSNLAFRTELERNRMAAQIGPVGASQLRVRTFEFLAQPTPETRRRWYESHARFGAMLAAPLMDGTPGEAIISALRARHAQLPELFEALARQRLLEDDASAPNPAVLGQARATSVQFMDATQQIAEDTLTLLELGQARLGRLQRNEEHLMAGLIVLLMLALGLQFLIVRRQVLEPLRALERGARAIEKGEYEHRIGMHAHNELGTVARQFDHMADALGETLQALHQQRSQLEVANRELESFSYSVSHDLRAPLRGIDGWAAALDEDFGNTLPAEAKDYIAHIRGECTRMNQLVDDLLQLARVTRSTLDFEWLELDRLAREVAERVRAAWPDRDIVFEIEADLTVWGDRRLLDIVLTNLFDNACKFTARVPQARIVLGSRVRTDQASGVAVKAYYVQDNGAGFDMQYARRLFTPFQRMHSQRDFPGTGIGLAIVHRIIQRHGGQLDAEAKPGEGACFGFTLPLQPGPALPARADARP